MYKQNCLIIIDLVRFADKLRKRETIEHSRQQQVLNAIFTHLSYIYLFRDLFRFNLHLVRVMFVLFYDLSKLPSVHSFHYFPRIFVIIVVVVPVNVEFDF